MTDVIVDREGPVMIVRLNRPDRRNAVGGRMLAELADAFDEAAADDSVRALVTTGEGSTFCVGADLSELNDKVGEMPSQELVNGTQLGGDKGLKKLSPQTALTERLGVGRWTQRMLALEKPTVAALNGSAAGGGLAIAVLHDFRIAASGAKLGTGFLRVGVGPEMGLSYWLPRLVGWQVATDLLLRSRIISAEEAASIRLVDEVVPSEKLLERAVSLAHELSVLPTLAVQMTKRLLRESAHADIEQQLESEYRAQLLLFGLPETRQTLAALRSQVLRPR